MKITINTLIEKEIELPKYWASDSGRIYHKQLDDNFCLEMGLGGEYIKRTYISTGTCTGVNEISETEFNLRLKEVKNILGIC